MQVLQINKSGRYKYKIDFEIEGQDMSMPLYFSEMRRYKITEDAVLPDETYERICKDVLSRRLMERSQYLLAGKSYTCHELKKKLLDAFYPEELVDATVSKLKEYHFLDDLEYATNYCQYRSKTRSTRQVKLELKNKGISQDIIDDLCAKTSDEEALAKILSRRLKNTNLNDPKEWNKQVRYLLGKGFEYNLINNALVKIKY